MIKTLRQTNEEMEIEERLKKYCNTYGLSAYIKMLTSTHCYIRGGWSWYAGKNDLIANIEREA